MISSPPLRHIPSKIPVLTKVVENNFLIDLLIQTNKRLLQMRQRFRISVMDDPGYHPYSSESVVLNLHS